MLDSREIKGIQIGRALYSSPLALNTLNKTTIHFNKEVFLLLFFLFFFLVCKLLNHMNYARSTKANGKGENKKYLAINLNTQNTR